MFVSPNIQSWTNKKRVTFEKSCFATAVLAMTLIYRYYDNECLCFLQNHRASCNVIGRNVNWSCICIYEQFLAHDIFHSVVTQKKNIVPRQNVHCPRIIQAITLFGITVRFCDTFMPRILQIDTWIFSLQNLIFMAVVWTFRDVSKTISIFFATITIKTL